MIIKSKKGLARAVCRHDYQEGILSAPGTPRFQHLGGTRATTVCVKCGKVKGTRFIPNADGS